MSDKLFFSFLMSSFLFSDLEISTMFLEFIPIWPYYFCLFLSWHQIWCLRFFIGKDIKLWIHTTCSTKNGRNVISLKSKAILKYWKQLILPKVYFPVKEMQWITPINERNRLFFSSWKAKTLQIFFLNVSISCIRYTVCDGLHSSGYIQGKCHSDRDKGT